MAGFYQADPYAEEQQRIQQNLLYAQQLQQQGLQPLQGQMVSNHFVAPSSTQGIANILKSYLGAKGQNDALTQTRELSQRAMADQQAATMQILSEPDPAKRVQAALSSTNPAARQLGNTLMADMLARGQIDYRSEKKIAENNADPSKLDFEQRKELAGIKPTDPNALTFDQRKELARIRGSSQGSNPYFSTLNTTTLGQLPMDARTGNVQVPGIGTVPMKDLPAVIAAHPELASQALVKPSDDPTRQGQIVGAKTEAKATAGAAAELADKEAAYPRLEQVASELSDLGKKATYTKAGQFLNSVKRQAGMDVGEGAVARTEYLAKIDNEVLPLLRQTFGAQFTQKEGESLKVTLGDPDKSPEEKDAVLKAFIESKKAQIATGQRRTGQTPTTNAKGWALHQDANGNKAYVGPNGEVEEVP